MQFNNEKKRTPQSNTFGGYTSRNYDTLTALAVNMFNEILSVSIHVGNRTGDSVQFNWKNGAFAYLQPKNCLALYKKGIKALKRYEETGQFEGFGIGLKKGLIEIASARELKSKLKHLKGEVDPNDICVVIYTDIGDDKKTNNYLIHVFNRDKYIKGYYPDTGNYTTEDAHVELEYFLENMYEFAKAMTNAYAHASKNEGKYQRERFERLVSTFASALGVDLSKPSEGSSGGSGNNLWKNNEKPTTISNREQTYGIPDVVDMTEDEINSLIGDYMEGD